MVVTFWLRACSALKVLLVLNMVAFVPVVRAAPTLEGVTASGPGAAQPRDCSGPRKEDSHCAIRGPGGLPTQREPIPPTLPPITLPPGWRAAGPPGDDEPPPYFFGTATASLHVTDEHQDVNYQSNLVNLFFMKRPVQDTPGKTEYALGFNAFDPGLTGSAAPLSMTWTAKGKVFNCTVEGQYIITFPANLNPIGSNLGVPGLNVPLDPSLPAYGYLNVVGPDGGDFYSVMVKAFDPGARLKQTCPGHPPKVTEVVPEAVYLLHILWRKNVYEDGRLALSGNQVFDAGKTDAFLDLLPSGPGRDFAIQQLSKSPVSTSGTSRQYTWEWTLIPLWSPADHP
jgi:hypothetical protein